MAHRHDPALVDGLDVPVITASTVVVGTGSAGYCAAARLADVGHDVVMVTDKVNAGASRNAGSDKQTYYKLTLSGAEPDSVHEMARTLYAGGAMDGDNALAEAATSARGFLHLCDLGVPFPQNRYGEYVGYKTDHDPRQRATSVGPYTSRSMVEQLEKKVQAHGVRVVDECRVVDVLTRELPDGSRAVSGLLVIRKDTSDLAPRDRLLLLRCRTVVYATGGPASMYATRVFPHGQWGATGAALRAGVHAKNVTEWQFGLASTHPRWNVSGTYMQVIPRFVSTDADGGDEREFLTEAIGDYGRLMSLTFLKGYQWPFDVRKVEGSSLIDLLVYRETVLRGRRVFLDFRSNPVHEDFDPAALAPEARDYLERAGVLFGTPIQRLRAMNEPAYLFYLERNPGIDLEQQMLEVDVCAQHNNGGLVVDAWWESNVRGLFPVGEAAGAHGVYRPGGAALNSGQVGATRAAQMIAAHHAEGPDPDDGFVDSARAAVDEARRLLESAAVRAAAGRPDSTGDLLREVQELMSRDAGPVRSAASVQRALGTVRTLLATFESTVSADAGSRRSVDRVFLLRDTLTAAYVYLSAMADYLEHGGRSRGSVLYSDEHGELPHPELPELFRLRQDGGSLDEEVQEVAWVAPGAPRPDGWKVTGGEESGAGAVAARWRERRPLPADDQFFENVWREYRVDGNVR